MVKSLKILLGQLSLLGICFLTLSLPWSSDFMLRSVRWVIIIPFFYLIFKYFKITIQQTKENLGFFIFFVSIILFLFASVAFPDSLKFAKWFLVPLGIGGILTSVHIHFSKNILNLIVLISSALAVCSILYLPEQLRITDPITTLYSDDFSILFFSYRIAFISSVLLGIFGLGNILCAVLNLFRENNQQELSIDKSAKFLVGSSLFLFVNILLIFYQINLSRINAILLISGILLNCIYFCSLKNQLFQPTLILQSFRIKVYLTQVFIAFAVFMFCHLFFAKIINPFHVDGDVWLHYLPYYLNVVDSNSFGPNEMWYHFFSSKGSIWQFFVLSITRNDISCIQLFAFLYFGICCLYFANSFIKQQEVKNTWILSLGILFGILGGTTSFGNFNKNHEYMFSMIIVILGSINRLEQKSINWIHYILISSCIFCTIFVPLITPFLCAALIFTYLTSKSTPVKKGIFFSALLSLIVFLAHAFYNFKAAGMFFDNPIKTVLKYANQTALSTFVDPFVVFYTAAGTSLNAGEFSIKNFFFKNEITNMGSILFIPNLLKIDNVCAIFGPWFLVFICFVISFKIVFNKWTPEKFVQINLAQNFNKLYNSPSYLLFLYSLIAIFCLLGVCFGLEMSLNRLATFTILGTLFVFITILFWCCNLLTENPKNRILFTLLVYLMIIISVTTNSIYACNHNTIRLKKVTSWLNGKIKSYEMSNFIPSYASWHLVKKYGLDSEEVLSLNVLSGPENVTQNKKIKSEVSYSLGNWSKLAFGTKKEFLNELSKQNIKYIVYDVNLRLFGAIAFRNDLIEILENNFNVYFFDQNLCIWVLKADIKQKDKVLVSKALDRLNAMLQSSTHRIYNKNMLNLYLFVREIYDTHGNQFSSEKIVYPKTQMGWQ